jgi:magnesium chelatase subunit I
MSLDAAETKSPTRARSWLLVVLAVVVWSSGTPPDRDVRAARLRFIAARVIEARARVTTVTLPDAVLAKAVELCLTLGADGLRGELTLMRAARARAALSGEAEVSMETLKSVAPLALRHRLRKDPLDDTDAGIRVERAVSEVFVS